MTSEDQTNKGLVSNSGSASESQEELYPDSPTNTRHNWSCARQEDVYQTRTLPLLSLPSRLRLPTILVHPFRTACSLQSAIAKRQPTSYYHPNDYYLGTDWPRLIVGTLASLILLVSVGILALYLFDRFESDTITTPTIVTSDGDSSTINAYCVLVIASLLSKLMFLQVRYLVAKILWELDCFSRPVAPSVQLVCSRFSCW